ncbi:MAG: ferritin-like domain-containing protein [Sorangiineae bacterium]|nr:ferritin-like domain-containing protein [Polyangiaceae bacterium]MEB2321463.1 ferritin-like domain-containing protein [Sorangiineae bacterium]
MSIATRPLNLERIEATLDVTYNWGYEETRAELRDLYRKAKQAQWDADERLDWSTDVDLDKDNMPEFMHPLYGSELYAKLTPPERQRLKWELAAWIQSQFLHGEQGALLAAAQLVNSVPDIDSKYYAATQVVDEARHVEVFDRYLHEKVGFSYPINPHLKQLLDLILTDSRWDMKLLGMQIMVEGLALAAFGVTRQTVYEPLLKSLTTYVIKDEARHVAYGVLSLRDYYKDVSEREVREREDFVYESAVLMRDRFLFQQVWEKMGMPVDECARIALDNEGQRQFRQILFSKIVPAVKRIGLLSPRQRERFATLGILEYESWQDPFEALAETEREQAEEASARAGTG